MAGTDKLFDSGGGPPEWSIRKSTVTATNWSSAPTLNYGSDRFDIDYTTNGFPGVTFSMPADIFTNRIRSWSTTVYLSTVSFSPFVVGAPAPLPVQLLNSTALAGQWHFSFTTLAGRPHTIQASTNLLYGSWLDLSNFVGDGSLKQLVFPTTNSHLLFFRVKTE